MNELLKSAHHYKALGFSIVPVKENKKSLGYWKNYQRSPISDFALERDFTNPNTFAIAIVCGKVSGNLEVIDLDGKYDNTLFERFQFALVNHDADLYARLVIASTKNNGYHFFYRCTEIEKHMTLARRPCSTEEINSNPDTKFKTLIEKLGEAGYAIVNPSPGYQFIQGSLDEIGEISVNERSELLKTAKKFDQLKKINKTKRIFSSQDLPELSPLHDYDARGDFISLLEHHGWTLVRSSGVQTYFRRPGDTEHDTSGDYHHELGLFTVFTPNCDFFTPYTGYRPHALYAILECNSDFKLAAKRLLQQGYGVSYKQRY